MANKNLQNFTKDELIQLLEIYAKNWLAMDGVWFQTVENKFGMQEAMVHNCNAWSIFTKLEAQRIKDFLQLPDKSGLAGLKKALGLRLYANINQDEIIISGHTLTYRVLECRVQKARQRKGLPFHPCKSVGIIEYSFFAQVIDPAFSCEALSCYPEVTDPTCNCAWKFTLQS